MHTVSIYVWEWCIKTQTWLHNVGYKVDYGAIKVPIEV